MPATEWPGNQGSTTEHQEEMPFRIRNSARTSIDENWTDGPVFALEHCVDRMTVVLDAQFHC